MKSKLLNSILLIIILLSVITSCKDSDNDTPTGNSVEQKTNKWIYEEMKTNYLWNTNITPNPNYNIKDPQKFFESLLYKKGAREGDRFSYMEEDLTNSRKSAYSNNLGFDIFPYYYFDGKSSDGNLGFYVVNVRPNTDAEKKGLKRGNLIYAVEGQTISFDNYVDMAAYLQELSSVEVQFYNMGGQKQTLKINSTNNYDPENPIWMAKIVQDQGVKVGYLVYNKFEREPSNDEGSYYYDVKLVEEIGKFYDQGITNIVIDLRYNPGGYVTSAVHLASALLPNRSKKDVFATHHYNKNIANRYNPNEYFADAIRKGKELIAKIPNSKLERLYILATENSASASELTIVGLRPYLGDKIKHIGTTTVGKDKASIAFSSNDRDIKWILHPLVSRLTNRDGYGNYIYGLKPNIEVNEWIEGYNYIEGHSDNEIFYVPSIKNWKCNWVELGNPREPLLAAAILDIKGNGFKYKSLSEEHKEVQSISVPKIKRLQREAMLIDLQETENNNQD